MATLGAAAVEVLPLAEVPGEFSWGYNPADLHSVENIAYGWHNDFKEFVKAAHARKLAVIVDVVHNHYGPNNLDMWKFDGWTSTKDGSGGGIYFDEPIRLQVSVPDNHLVFLSKESLGTPWFGSLPKCRWFLFGEIP